MAALITKPSHFAARWAGRRPGWPPPRAELDEGGALPATLMGLDELTRSRLRLGSRYYLEAPGDELSMAEEPWQT